MQPLVSGLRLMEDRQSARRTAMPARSEYSHPDLPNHIEQAKQMTKLLRAGQDSRWLQLRQCLSERGINATSSVLANLFPDGEYQEWGLIVMDDRRFSSSSTTGHPSRLAT